MTEGGREWDLPPQRPRHRESYRPLADKRPIKKADVLKALSEIVEHGYGRLELEVRHKKIVVLDCMKRTVEGAEVKVK